MNIDWQNSRDKDIFAKAELINFADFIYVEQRASKVNLLSMRDHRDKKSGKIDRQMTRITIDNNIYYMKRAYCNSFKNVKNEYEAIKVLPKFGLKPAEIVAYAFNESEKKGFIILKDLTGFYSISEIIKGNTPDDTLNDFISRKDEILQRTAKIIRDIHKKGYVYPDWFAKHIYIKKGCDEIVLIDLERFLPIDKCPWYFSFPVTSFFVKQKIFRKLRISLMRDSDLLSGKYLRSILH